MSSGSDRKQEEIEQLYRALEIADDRVAKAEQQAATAHEQGAQEKVRTACRACADHSSLVPELSQSGRMSEDQGIEILHPGFMCTIHQQPAGYVADDHGDDKRAACLPCGIAAEQTFAWQQMQAGF